MSRIDPVTAGRAWSALRHFSEQVLCTSTVEASASRCPASLVGAEAKDLMRFFFHWYWTHVILKNLERLTQWVAMPWMSAEKGVVYLAGGKSICLWVAR